LIGIMARIQAIIPRIGRAVSALMQTSDAGMAARADASPRRASAMPAPSLGPSVPTEFDAYF
jgi:hypothetical protein